MEEAVWDWKRPTSDKRQQKHNMYMCVYVHNNAHAEIDFTDSKVTGC